MPRKVISKKAAAVRGISKRVARGKTKKLGPKVTNEEIHEFLHDMRQWWSELGGDMANLETMITRVPSEQPPSIEVTRKFRSLIRMVAPRPFCFFPIINEICMAKHKPGPKTRPR